MQKSKLQFKIQNDTKCHRVILNLPALPRGRFQDLNPKEKRCRNPLRQSYSEASKFGMTRSEGFTLVELLAVIIILIAVGSVIGAILFASLRGTNKTNAVTEVRQNGNYAISQMSKMIRDAKSFGGASVAGVSYDLNCVLPTVGALTPTPTRTPYKYVKIMSFDNGQTIFSCPSTTISSNSASLIDTSVVTVSSCTFTCAQDSLSESPRIDISFSLVQVNLENLPVERLASASGTTIPFKTSVVLRNFNR